jgi:hypothetical protein
MPHCHALPLAPYRGSSSACTNSVSNSSCDAHATLDTETLMDDRTFVEESSRRRSSSSSQLDTGLDTTAYHLTPPQRRESPSSNTRTHAISHHDQCLDRPCINYMYFIQVPYINRINTFIPPTSLQSVYCSLASQNSKSCSCCIV